MKDKRYKKIKNQIIASASSGLVAGMFLVGGINTVYAETPNKTLPVYTHKKVLENKTYIYKNGIGKKIPKGWRKNVI